MRIYRSCWRFVRILITLRRMIGRCGWCRSLIVMVLGSQCWYCLWQHRIHRRSHLRISSYWWLRLVVYYMSRRSQVVSLAFAAKPTKTCRVYGSIVLGHHLHGRLLLLYWCCCNLLWVCYIIEVRLVLQSSRLYRHCLVFIIVSHGCWRANTHEIVDVWCSLLLV